MADRLTGRRILIMETREEAQFLRLLRDQGADVVQCPMFSIEDAPDPAPVEAWVGRAIASPLSDLVLLTGEGMRRLAKLARRLGLYDQLIGGTCRNENLRPRSQAGQSPARAWPHRCSGIRPFPPRRALSRCSRTLISPGIVSGSSSIPSATTVH